MTVTNIKTILSVLPRCEVLIIAYIFGVLIAMRIANRDLLTSLMPKTVKDINLSWNITFLFPESSNLTTTVHPPAIVNFHKEVATQNRKLTKRLFEEIVDHADPRLNVTVNDIDKARPKMVLFYNYSSSPVNWARQFEGCAISNCIMTNTTKDLRFSGQFDAVMINVIEYRNDENAIQLLKELSRYRNLKQRWVATIYESPRLDESLPFVNQHLSKNLFNWTQSYKTSSDIYSPRMYWLIENNAPHPGPLWDQYPKRFTGQPDMSKKSKTNLVHWIVSNCRPMSRRDEYVKELAKYTPVDIFGGCGNQTACPRSDTCPSMMAERYKFYLSFENSVCKEYVTEKLHRTLDLPTIPIVLGGADYQKITPDKSVINVLDFKSPKELVEYLQHLNENDNAYLEYFEWKLKYRGYRRRKMGNCELCAKLHDETEPVKSYPDLYHWWYYEDDNRESTACKVIKNPLKFFSSDGET